MLDGGLFDMHGDIDDFRAEDANGEDEVEYDRLQITTQLFTWRNARQIIKFSDHEDCKSKNYLYSNLLSNKKTTYFERSGSVLLLPSTLHRRDQKLLLGG